MAGVSSCAGYPSRLIYKMEKAFRPCAVASCNRITQEKYCDIHKDLAAKRTRRDSEKWKGLYKSARYQAARKSFMAAHPWCARCGELAAELDHIIPHEGNMKLFYDQKNWQTLCKRCHSQKTATEDNGFGRRPPGVGQNVFD